MTNNRKKTKGSGAVGPPPPLTDEQKALWAKAAETGSQEDYVAALKAIGQYTTHRDQGPDWMKEGRDSSARTSPPLSEQKPAGTTPEALSWSARLVARFQQQDPELYAETLRVFTELKEQNKQLWFQAFTATAAADRWRTMALQFGEDNDTVLGKLGYYQVAYGEGPDPNVVRAKNPDPTSTPAP